MSTFAAELGGPMSVAEVDAVIAHIRSWPTDGLPTPAPAPGGGNASAGRDVYTASCETCHGADGTSPTAPDLANPTFQSAATDEYIRYAIVNGRPGTLMEPVPITEQEIADVIAYIRLWGSP
jgi:mono/diheme cytochrome c family protein